MTPISRLVNSSQVSSESDPPLSDSLLIKWRPMTGMVGEAAGGGIGSWESDGNYAIIPSRGLLVSWLVSVSSEQIMGFIVQGECLSTSSPHFLDVFRSHYLELSHPLHPLLLFPKTLCSSSLQQ